ncbi:flagellar motor protein MotB [Spirochaetia bacterium 38H-sp]|uniref:Flagellar motor protein MotB n=1 Tax=Rarispira pelagica TaxID=3141764 RepID=A0ABU9UDA2_9SPIR
MAEKKKKEKKADEGAPDYMLTYGDMVTLLLTFFVMMFTTATVDGYQVRLILSAFPGLGSREGGNTLSVGRLAELGNTVMSLPSMQRGRALDEARKKAISAFQPEIKAKTVRVKQDERGLVITLAADAFFRSASAELNIEAARETLIKLSNLLSSPELADRKIRIEGHTDNIPTDPAGPWPSNWELSADRSINVLHFLSDYGVDEQKFQAMGLADTVPLADNATPEGRAYNRRVDIIILSDGHL